MCEKEKKSTFEEKYWALRNETPYKPLPPNACLITCMRVCRKAPWTLFFPSFFRSSTEHTHKRPFSSLPFNLRQEHRPAPPQSASLRTFTHHQPNIQRRKVMSSRTTTVRPTRTTTKSQDTSSTQQQTEPPSTQDRCAHCKKFLSAVKAECRHCRLIFCMEHR